MRRMGKCESRRRYGKREQEKNWGSRTRKIKKKLGKRDVRMGLRDKERIEWKKYYNKPFLSPDKKKMTDDDDDDYQ